MRRDFGQLLEKAWNEMIEWQRAKRFAPMSEEDVQCLLYHLIVSELGSASKVHAKPTVDKPTKCRFKDGRLHVGNMHFPDFSLGDGDVVAEIKVSKPPDRGQCIGGCRADVEKMKKHHGNATRYFFLFELGDPKSSCLDEEDLRDLQSRDPECRILIHPTNLNVSPFKAAARKANAKMKDAGVDFCELGRRNAARAIQGGPPAVQWVEVADLSRLSHGVELHHDWVSESPIGFVEGFEWAKKPVKVRLLQYPPADLPIAHRVIPPTIVREDYGRMIVEVKRAAEILLAGGKFKDGRITACVSCRTNG